MNFRNPARDLLARILLGAGFVVVALGLAPAAQAQTTIFKTNNNTNSLTSTAAWSNSTGGAGGNPTTIDASDIGKIDSTLLAANASLTFSSTLTLGGLQITNPGAAITLNGSGAVRTFNLGNASFANGGGIDMSNATVGLTLGANVATVLQGRSQTWTIGNATSHPGLTVAGTLNLNQQLQISGNGPVTISGVISGANDFYQFSSNTTTLSGVNTMTGVLNLESGTLVLTNNGTAAGSSAGLGTLALSGGNLNTGATAVTLATNNNVTIYGGFTFLGSNNLNLGTGNTFVANDATLTVSANTVTLNNVSDGWNGTSNAWSSGLSLTKAGAGGLTLNGTGHFSGNLNLTAGTLTLASNLAMQNATLNFTGGTVSFGALTNATLGGLAGNQGLTLAAGFALTLNTNAYDNDVYSGNIAASTATVTINGTGTEALSGNNAYSGGTTLAGGTLAINNGGNATTSAIGTGTLTITGGNLDNTSGANVTVATNNAEAWNGNFTFIGTNNLNMGTGAVTMNASRTVTISASTLTVGGNISGTGFSLTKAGAGELVLSGNSTYSGGTTLSAGKLDVNNGGNTTTSAIGTGTLTLLGGVLDNTSGANVTVATNNAQSWNGDFTFLGTNNLSLGTGAVTMNASRTVTVSAGTLTVGGAIHGAGFSLTKAGSGTLVLTGSSNYSGATVINGGILSANVMANGGTNSSIGNSSAAASNLIINGGTLQYTGAVVSTNRSITVGQNGATLDASGTGAITFTNTSAVTFANSSAPANITFTGSNTSTNTFNATIGNSGTGANVTTVTKSGTGEWVLNATNTYSGGTVLNAGTLALKNASAIGTGLLTINGGTLDNTNATMTLSGNNAQAWNANWTFVGTNSLNMGTGAVSMNTNTTLTVTGNTLTIGGAISDNGYGYNLSKAGAGNLVLSGTNTFSGSMIVNAGTLTLGSTTALQNATLSYNGGTVTLATGTNFLGGFAGNTALNITTNNLTINTATGTTANYTAILSGTGNIVIAGNGTEIFSGASTYSGTTNITGGTLILSGARTGTAGVTNLSGGTLVLNNNGTTTTGVFGNNGTLTITGGNLDTTLANTNLATVDPQNWNGNFTFLGTGNLNLGTGGVTMNASRTVTVLNSTLTVGGNIGGSTFGLTKAGAGNLVLAGTNTYNGSTTVSEGTLTLDFTTRGNNTTNIINSTSALVLAGGTLNVIGVSGTGNTNSQTFNGTTVNAGASTITGTMAVGSTTGLAIALGTTTRTAGGTLQVNKPTAGNVTGTFVNTNNVVTSNGIAYMTFGTTDWANGTGTLSATAAASYANNTANSTWAATTNLRISSNITMSAARTLGTLLYNGTTSNFTLNTGGFNLTVNTGGLLMSSNATGNFTITGGNIMGQASANDELVVIQNMAAGSNFTIASKIINNGSNGTILTKSGTGELILNGTNTYSGNTYLNQGTLALGSNTALGTGTLVIDGGTLDATVTTNLTNNNAQNWTGNFGFAGTNNLNMGTGAITMTGNRVVTVSGNTLTEGGNISGTGFSLTKNGTGVLMLTGGGSTYSGGTIINNGVLEVSGNNALGAAGSNVTVNSGGTLRLDDGFDITGVGATGGSSNGSLLTITGADSGFVGLQNGNGTSEWQGNIALVGNAIIDSGSQSGASITIGNNGASYTSNVSLGNHNLTFTGNFATSTVVNANITGVGNVIIDTGGVVQYFMDSNAYLGTTSVNNGTLILDTTSNGVPTTPGSGNVLAINGNLVIGDGIGAANTAAVQMGTGGTDVERFTINANSAVTINQDGLFNILGQDQTIAALTMNGGNIDTTDHNNNAFGLLGLNGNASILANANSSTISGNFNMANSVGNVTTVFTVASGGNVNGDLVVNALLSGGSMVKNGAGNMVLNNTLNSYTGTTEVQTGTLNIQANGALGAADGTAGEGTTVDAGGQLQMQNGITVSNEYLTLNGNGTGSSDGALQNKSGDNTWGGTINAASDATINTTANSLYVSGCVTTTATNATLTINGSGNTTISGNINGGLSLVKNGAGTLMFNGTASNSYSGTTTVNAGTLELNQTANTVAVSGSTLTINNGGTLLSDNTENIGNGVNMVLNGGTWVTNGSGGSSFTENLNTLTLTATSNLTLGANSNVVAFTDSHSQTWQGDSILYINGWDGQLTGAGTDQVFFGTSSAGLGGTSYTGQLGEIIFVNPVINGSATSSNYHAIILSTGEVVPFLPAPEPGTVAAGAGLGLLALLREARRRRERNAAKV